MTLLRLTKRETLRFITLRLVEPDMNTLLP
jgi:hypothetical protein